MSWCADRTIRAGLLATILGLGACHVQLVGDYDPAVADGAAAVAGDLNTVIESERDPVKPGDSSYAANQPAYNRINAELQTLLVRAEAHDKNQYVVNQIRKLIETVRALEQIHRQEGRLPAAYLDAKQQDIEAEIAAIIRTENAKKAVASSGP